MEKKGKPSYSPEFRGEAVKLVLEQGLSIEGAAKRLNLPKGTLAHWVRGVKLRRALAEAQMERDILKKATVYFAKESQKDTRK